MALLQECPRCKEKLSFRVQIDIREGDEVKKIEKERSECPKCGHIDIAYEAQITSCGCYDKDYYDNLFFTEDKIFHGMERTPRLLKAYSIAKKYKFDGSKKKAEKLHSQGSLFL